MFLYWGTIMVGIDATALIASKHLLVSADGRLVPEQFFVGSGGPIVFGDPDHQHQ